MSQRGQPRHFGRRPTTSGLPLKTDVVTANEVVPVAQPRNLVLLRLSRQSHEISSHRLFGYLIWNI